jgi:CRISPR locus-related DNA-binding protein
VPSIICTPVDLSFTLSSIGREGRVELKKLVVSSIGFDVNLVVRSLLKVGITPSDVVVLVYSLTGDDISKKRVSEAVSTMKGLLRGAGVEVVDCEVTGMDFFEDVKRVINILKKLGPSEVIASLVGGMRMTLFAILFAIELITRSTKIKALIHLMREDGLYDITLKAPLVSKLGRSEARVLRLMKELGLSNTRRADAVKKLSEVMKVGEMAVRKVLESLERKGLISASDGLLRLEKVGEILCELY